MERLLEARIIGVADVVDDCLRVCEADLRSDLDRPRRRRT
jgi:hypothetical protein